MYGKEEGKNANGKTRRIVVVWTRSMSNEGLPLQVLAFNELGTSAREDQGAAADA